MANLSLCRWGFIAALFLIICLFLSCHSVSDREPGTFIIGLESAPANLDPRLAADAYSAKICHLIYAGLFRLDESLQLQPYLLESFREISPTEYQFTIKQGIRFHDGRLLTARDVIWTYESIRNHSVPSPHFATFAKIDSLVLIDELNFRIVLKEPFAPFLSALTIGILPENTADILVGSGPFQLEEQVPDEKIVLKGFEQFFGGPARAKRLVFKIVREDNLRVLDLVRGQIDLLQNNVPVALIPYVEKKKDVVLESTPGINYSYLGFNLTDPRLASIKVREAIEHAINIDKIIEYKLGGFARPAGSILAPMHWAYAETNIHYPYDPARARSLLDEAGFPDPDGDGPQSRFRIIYKTSSKRDRVGLARLIAQYLRDVGIEVVVTPFEWGTLFRDIQRGNFQLYSLTWVGVTEPDIYYYVFNSSQFPPDGANRNRYVNKAVDQLTESGRSTINQARRKKIYAEVQKIVAREIPYISLWYEDNVVLRRSDVKGYVIYPNASFAGLAGLYREEQKTRDERRRMSR